MHKRKDGRWEETVATPSGKTKHFYGKTQAEVKRKIAAFTEEIDKGPLFKDALDDWLEYKESKVDPKTYEGYQAPVKRLKDTFGEDRCRDITPGQIQAFIIDLASKGYKRATVQRPLDVMRMCFNWLIVEGVADIRSNPCDPVELPRGLKQERRDLASREDIQRIKDSVNLPFGLFAYLLIYTGLRRNEALALTYKDFDFKNGRINIDSNIGWTGGTRIKDPKTEAGIRYVPILSPLKAVLPKKWNGYLFSADHGKSPLSETQYRHRWAAYCKAAGLCDLETVEHRSTGANKRMYTKTIYKPRVVPHQLRHEFATLCLDAELDAADTKEIMGHASIATTQAIYQHITESRREKNTKKLEDYLSAE